MKPPRRRTTQPQTKGAKQYADPKGGLQTGDATKVAMDDVGDALGDECGGGVGRDGAESHRCDEFTPIHPWVHACVHTQQCPCIQDHNSVQVFKTTQCLIVKTTWRLYNMTKTTRRCTHQPLIPPLSEKRMGD